MLRAFPTQFIIHIGGIVLLAITTIHFPGLQALKLWESLWEPETEDTENQPPEVRIIAPADGSEHSGGTMIRYQIEVIDHEDGSSEFGEIPPQMVSLEVTQLPGIKEAERYRNLVLESQNDPDGLLLIKSSGCFNCHSDKARLVGPSWLQLSQQYTPDPATLQTLANQVILGSKGSWGEEPMPAHPDLSPNEIPFMIAYMLEQGAKKQSCIYTGLDGSVRIDSNPDNDYGVFLLTASYTDSGVDGDPSTRKRSQHSIIVKVVPRD